MELARSTKLNLNLTTEIEVLSYTYSGANPIEVFARVDLGLGTALLSGVGGSYLLNIYINGVPVEPASAVTVPAGKTQSIMTSRQIALNSGDAVSIRVMGLSGDTNVSTLASLRDATPIAVTDIEGAGARSVDHNYGGPDALAASSPAGARLSGVHVVAYLASDYAAGNQGPQFQRGSSITDINGRWQHPIMLDPGSYTLLFYLQGVYQPQTVSLTVV